MSHSLNLFSNVVCKYTAFFWVSFFKQEQTKQFVINVIVISYCHVMLNFPSIKCPNTTRMNYVPFFVFYSQSTPSSLKNSSLPPPPPSSSAHSSSGEAGIFIAGRTEGLVFSWGGGIFVGGGGGGSIPYHAFVSH